mgnify:FL=1
MNVSWAYVVVPLMLTASLGIRADSGTTPVTASELASMTFDDVKEIELQTIEKRKALASGRLILKVQTTVDVAHPSQTEITKWHDIVFKGDWIREARRAVSASVDQTGQTMWARGELVRIPAREDDWGQILQQQPGQRSDSHLTDPRLLGLAAWHYDTMGRFGYDSGGVLDPNRRNVNIEAATRDQKRLLKVSYDFDAKVGTISCKRWLDPDLDFLPVLVELLFPESSAGGGRLLQSLSCELQRYPPNSVPYPSKVVFRTQRGDEITSEEVVVVESAEFGDVDDSAFSLAALELARGRVFDANGVLMHWSGEELLPGETPVKQPLGIEHDERIGGRRVNWILLVNAFFLALVAAVLCARWFRASRSHG